MRCEDGLHNKIIYFFLAGHLAACKEVELLGGRPALVVAPLAVDVESLKKCCHCCHYCRRCCAYLGSSWGRLGVSLGLPTCSR